MDIQKFVSRLLSLLLCVAMVVSYLPGISIGAKAEAVATDKVEMETALPEAAPEDITPENEFPDVEVVEPSVEEEEVELLASGTNADGLAWTLDVNGHLQITGTGDLTDAPWLNYQDSIYTVTVGEGITSIGAFTFDCCGNMTTIDIPDTVQHLDGYIFQNCYNLTGIHIPYGVESIGDATFNNCYALANVEIPESVTSIGNTAFASCDALVEVDIPDSVTSIGSNAFWWSNELSVITIGSGVTSMGDCVFEGCNNLETIRFKGDAPEFCGTTFSNACVTAYYPRNNETWTDDVLQAYGGEISWIGVGELIGINLLTDELLPVAVGTVLDETHIRVELIYEDDIRFTASFEELTISDYNTSEVGRQEVVVAYGDQSVTVVVAVHEGAANQLIDPALYPESDHYYGNGLNEYKTFEVPGASSITLTFAPECYLESNCDVLYIYDDQSMLIATLTGSGFGGTSVKVPGSTVVLRLYTDGSVTEYGYAFSEIRANTVYHTGEAVEAVDPTCTQDGHTAGIYCTICDAPANVAVLPALGHCYDAVRTDPTPETQGYTTYTCPVCGDSYVDDYTTYDNVANGQCGENVTWGLSYEGTLTISGTGPMYEEYGYDTMDWKDAGYDIKNVIIEEGVTTIAAYAFADCSNLTSVWMADTVETIGYDSFYYCYNLTDLTIGNGVLTIEEYAFNSCYNLKTLVIPDSVQTIDYGAFQYCTALENITFGSGVTSIGGSAFRSAQNVTVLELPDSLQTIGSCAFAEMDALTSVSIPAATSNISADAFYSGDALLSFEVHPDNPNYSTDSYGALFDKNQTLLIQFPLALGGEYEVPGTVTTISGYAFSNAQQLTAVSIPGSVKTIEYYAFYNCDAMTTLTLGEGIETIDDYAFYDCDQLTAVVIPDSVQTIGHGAFQYCERLRAVTLGSGLTNMGGYVFQSCTALETIEFTGNAPYISYGVFNNVTTTAYYPMNNETWTDEVLQGYYGGSITWVALGEVIGFNVVDDVIILGVGGSLNDENLHAELIREGDVRMPVSVAELTISGFDNTATGRREITVSYGSYSDTVILAVHDGDSNYQVDPSLYPESEHPYSHNMDETKVFTVPGANSITLYFSNETELESCDYLYILDKDDQQIARFYGGLGRGAVVTVPGDTVKLRMTSDGSVSYYGYSFSDIRADAVVHTGEQLEAVAPTCEAPGYTAGMYCTICEAYIREELPALGHSYDVVRTDPTPETQGYTTYTCSVCGDCYVDNYTTYDNVASGVCGDSLTWVLSFEGKLTISGTGDMYDYNAELMNWKDIGYPVTEIVIEEGVTSIGRSAFGGCYNLTAVEIPNTVTTIGSDAFTACDSLESVVIPDSVTTIEYDAFYDCHGLKSLSIGNGVTTIGEYAFRCCCELTSVSIGNSVSTIGDGAFEACSKLSVVNIPASVTAIGSSAFENCNSLTGIFVDESNPYYCSGANGVLFDKSQTVLIHAPATMVGDYTVPDTVTTIGRFAFKNCSSLTAVTISNSVTTIDEYAFAYCSALTDLTMSNALTSLGYAAFQDCDALQTVTIPDSVENIGSVAFYNCDNLTSVTVGSGVTAIDSYAFGDCYSLKTVYFSGDAPNIDYSAFRSVTAVAYYPMNNLTWTEDVRQNYYGTISWVAVAEIIGMELESDRILLCVGEALNESHIQAELVREGGIRTPVDFNELTISEFDNSVVGQQKIVVCYGEYAATAIVAVHEGREEQVIDPSRYPESTHNYADNLDETQVLTVPGAESITMTFCEQTEFESGWDYLHILNGNDEELAVYSSTELAGATIVVAGDTVKLRLTTDGSSTRYGYAFTEIRAMSIKHTGSATEGLEPTCTEDGYTAGIFCELCQEETGVAVLPALGHSYDAVRTDPTPETGGYTTYICSVCGDSYVDNYTTYDNVANGICGEDLTWVLSFEGTLTISGSGAMYHYGSATLPWKNTPYTVKKAVLEEGVTAIGSYAFLNCEELEEITLPSTLTTIGYSAFNNCYKLKTIEIPESVTVIESYAFLNCNALETVELPVGIESINHGTFLNCSALTGVTIPDTVTEIYNEAFCGCTSLSELQIPESVSYIGQSVFFNCQSLTELELPDSLTELPYGLFSGCTGLTQIVIPAGVTEIGDSTFNQCTSLTSVTVPEGVTCIGNNAFANCTGLREIQLPQSLTELGFYAFSDCRALESFSIPEGITTVHSGLLIRCYGLKSVSIPDSVTRIEDWSFAETNALTSVTIPDSVEYLGMYCFYSSDMKSVTIGAGVTEIASSAFYCCYDLQTVTFTGNAPEIAEDAFRDVTITAYYPAGNETWTETACQSYGGQITWITSGSIGIIEQPLSHLASDGQTASFFVEAVGKGLVYQWQYRTSANGSWKNASAEGNKTPELLVPATVSRHGYEYRCKITDSEGNEIYTNPATLFVLGIAQQPANVYTKPDGNAGFTVEATGMDLYYQWEFRSSDKGQWAETSATGCNTPTLTVPATSWRNGYQYRCVITEISGATVVTDVVTLYVLDITTQPVNRTTAIGADAEFKVVATGGGLTYQWQYRTSSSGSWKNAAAEGNTTATLTVPATASRGGYQYRCVITDEAGNKVTTSAATLYVWGINTQPASKTVKAGTTAKFTVSATGDGLKYQWQYRTSSSGSWKSASATGSKTKTLSVPATTARHGYQYRCKITNSAGNTTYTKAVTLYVLGIKTQPTHKTVKSGTSVTFKVSATGRTLTYQWQYRTSSDGSWKNASAASAKTAKYVLSAKVKHHGYQYRCRIKDAAGNTVYTNVVNLKVLGINTQPTNKTVVSGKTAKFTVSATGSNITYQWQYRTSSDGSWKNTSATGNKTKTLSIAATATKHGYQYRCKITDSAGNVIYTNTVNLYVLGIKTQPASKTVKVGATAKFTVSATGNGLTYQWQYRTSSDGSWKNTSATGSKTKTLSVSATTSKNGYQYRCKITDSAGNVIYTDAAKLTVKK